MTIAELLAKHAATITTPANGDRAYTTYRGRTYVGHLFDVQPHHEGRFLAKLKPTSETGDWHLHVGYDGPIQFDAAAGCWNAHADHD